MQTCRVCTPSPQNRAVGSLSAVAACANLLGENASSSSHLREHWFSPASHTQKDPTSLLAQVVSGDHDTRSFQVSYSGGRRAQFWNRLKMEDPRQFRSLLRKELRKQLPARLRKKRLRRIRSHHFEHATHYWVPAFGFKGVEESARQSVVPHPNKLPGLYWVGEAFPFCTRMD